VTRGSSRRSSAATSASCRAWCATGAGGGDRRGGLLLAGIGYATFKDQFLPDFRETDFLMHFVEKPGTSIEAMDRITIRASKELRAIPGVRNFGAHIGRAEQADEVVGPNFTELWISLDENADYDASVKRIKEVVEGYPGLYRDVLTYLRERIKEVLTGAGATIVVRIYGPDQAELRAAGARVREAISGVPGVSDLKLESQVLVPQIRIRLICPPLSGPETMIVWTAKGTLNAEQEAQAGRDHRQAA
jgi:Cu/Ag efflux pump CusA